MRSSFKGTIRFGLLTVPVKAYTTKNSKESITLNQLHCECKSRIKYQKQCPCCGPVAHKEIERGYEYAKDQYVIVDPAEIKSEDKTIDVVGFVKPGKIHDRYNSGKSYYLAADDVGEKAYHLLVAAMRKKKLDCFAKAVVLGKEQLVSIRSIDGVLVLTVLHYAEEIRGADVLDFGEASHSKQELSLTLDLIAQTTVHDVVIEDYSNPYNDRLRALVDAKVEGNEFVSPPAAEDTDETPVINLMDALQQSVDQLTAKSATTRRKKSEVSACMKLG